ncbi:hypothetical protein DFH09DRAFT_1093570 [Mycena vulgaris]|nr:hypothetical protein DFH09DRAFT_1093570 [Mycena vulgaris]
MAHTHPHTPLQARAKVQTDVPQRVGQRVLFPKPSLAGIRASHTIHGRHRCLARLAGNVHTCRVQVEWATPLESVRGFELDRVTWQPTALGFGLHPTLCEGKNSKYSNAGSGKSAFNDTSGRTVAFRASHTAVFESAATTVGVHKINGNDSTFCKLTERYTPGGISRDVITSGPRAAESLCSPTTCGANAVASAMASVGHMP